MLGNRYSNVFRSRWRALIWASGVLLTAYCTVPSADAPAPPGADAAKHAKHARRDAWGNLIGEHGGDQGSG